MRPARRGPLACLYIVLLAAQLMDPVLAAQGTLDDPILLPAPCDATEWLSLADGHLQLSQQAASACGYSADTFASQNKLAVGYQEAGAGTQRTFAMCNSADFVQNFWLLTCPYQLSDAAGADAASAGCTCQLADDGYYSCAEGGQYGFQGTVQTQPGSFYYVLAQANPPDTGADPSRQFRITLTGSPDECASANNTSSNDSAAAGSTGAAELSIGQWPLSKQQTGCVAAAAAASEEFGRYLFLAALGGAVMMWGPASQQAEALRALPGATELGGAPIRQVLADMSGWASSTLQSCGAADSFAFNGSSAPVDLAAWWLSLDEPALAADLGAPPAPDEGPTGRRLLWSLGQALGPGGTRWAARAVGLFSGFAAETAGAVVADQIVTWSVAAGTVMGGPIGAGLGLGVGLVLGTIAAHYVAEEFSADSKEMASLLFEGDETALQAFEQGAGVGELAAAVAELGVSRRVPVGEEVKEGMEQLRHLDEQLAPVERKIGDYADTWRRIVQDPRFPGSANLQQRAAQAEANRLAALEQASPILKQALTGFGKTLGKMARPLSSLWWATQPEEGGEAAGGEGSGASGGEGSEPSGGEGSSASGGEGLVGAAPDTGVGATQGDASGSAGQPAGGGACQACAQDGDCGDDFFVRVCNSCGRGGARCGVAKCCECPRCYSTSSGGGRRRLSRQSRLFWPAAVA